MLYLHSFNVKCQTTFISKSVLDYTKKVNLPNINIRKIFEDKYGYLWISTTGGLVRYDGKNTIAYKAGNNGNESLYDNNICNAFYDRQTDKIWVGYYNGAIETIDINTGKPSVVFMLPPTDLKENLILNFIKRNEEIYFTTYEGVYFFNIQDMRIKKIEFKSETSEFFNQIILDSLNRIWLFSNKGSLLQIHNHQGIYTPVHYGFTNPGLTFTNWGCKLLENYKICINTSRGIIVFKYDTSGFLYIDKANPLSIKTAEQEVSFMEKDILGNVFYALGNVFYKYDHTSLVTNRIYMTNEADKKITKPYASCLTSRGDIWVGTIEGLFYMPSDISPFKRIIKPSFSAKENIHCYFLLPMDYGESLCCLESGLAYVDEKTGSWYIFEKDKIVYYAFKMPDGEILVSSNKGNFFFSKGDLSLKKLPSRYSILNKQDDIFQSHQLLNDSIIILSSRIGKGLIRWNYKNNTCSEYINSKSLPSLPENNIQTIYLDEKGLFVLSNSNVSLVSKDFLTIKKVPVNTSQPVPPKIFFDMLRYNGHYFICSYGTGVIELDENLKFLKLYNEKTGLCNNGVYKIKTGVDNQLFISTDNGLALLNPETGLVKNFYEDDGLHSDYFEETSASTNGSTLLFGGVNGYTIVNPLLVKKNIDTPTIIVDRLEVESLSGLFDTTNHTLTKYILANDVLQTRVYFTAFNWSNPERVYYKWRLLKNGGNWINNGNLNFITLMGLSPGIYHLQVKAANEDGVWSEPKELVLEFLPKWYQTWWFKLLVLLTTAGIIYAFYRYRIRQIKKQHEIRKNIATDLHDDLGSTLNSVKVFTNLAISGVKQEESLQQVKDNLTEATMSLRDMIWVLDDSLDTVDELVTRLKQFAFPITAASNMEFVVNSNSDVNSLTLTKEEKRNLFLICKEAINNSIKYSGASKITVDIQPAGKKIQIIVADNGKGFDETTVKKGYGLKNMQYRAGQVKYAVKISSQLSKGVTIIIEPI